MNMNFKNILVTTLCVLLLAGCSNSPYAKAEAQTMDIQGVKVYVEPDDDTLQKDVNTYIENLKKQPGYLMKNCKSIYLQGKTTYQQGTSNYNNLEGSAGYALYDESVINLLLFSFDTDEDADSDCSATHELWHLYDYTYGENNLNCSEMPEFVNLYNSSPNSITDYGSTNSIEFFAEAGAMYVNSPDKLKEANMDVYNYFEALPKE